MNWYSVGETLIIAVVILFVIRMIRRSITKQNRLPSSAGYTPHDEMYKSKTPAVQGPLAFCIVR